MTRTKAYQKRQAKARQRRRRNPHERFQRDQAQAQRAAQALEQALQELALPQTLVQEIEGRLGYRRVRADYAGFKSDLEVPPAFEMDRKLMLERLRPYLEAQHIPVDVDVIKGLSDPTLVTSLCMICPFDPREKQALLESPNMHDRAETLLKLLQMGVFDAGASDALRQ